MPPAEFDAWLDQAMQQTPADREKALVDWRKAPAGEACHPREEHLIPLMVVAGAASEDRGAVAYSGRYGGVQVSGYQFGA